MFIGTAGRQSGVLRSLDEEFQILRKPVVHSRIYTPCSVMHRASLTCRFPVCRRNPSAYRPSTSSLFGRQERPARPSWIPFAWVHPSILACLLSQAPAGNKLSVTCRADGQYLRLLRGSSPQQACAFSLVFVNSEFWELISAKELKVTYCLGCCRLCRLSE